MNEALQKLILDIDCLDELAPWTRGFNIFDVLKVSRAEIRHSNTLAWLLDPNETHGLGDAYLRAIIQRLANKLDDKKSKLLAKILVSDLHDFVVYREYENIDILLRSRIDKTLIAIENKVGSSEHSDQLNRYRKILEEKYKGYTRILIFLTPEGTLPSDAQNWDVFTYTDVVDTLENVMNKKELHSGVKLMIQNYIEVVRRDVVEDEQLIEICEKIYSRHKQALDLIFKYKPDGTDFIKNALMQLAEEDLIIYDPEWKHAFQTVELCEKLPPLDERKSSFNTNYIASYWFDVKDGQFSIVFELGGWNVPEESMAVMKRMIQKLKPNDKRGDNFRYKRLYRTSWYELNDIQLVRDAVEEIYSMQEELLKSIEEN